MSSHVLASRRKQSKPQRVHEEEMDDEDALTLPMDLSTTSARKEKNMNILEDKSNLFQSFASFASPQQLLNLCVQYAARESKQLNDVAAVATVAVEPTTSADFECPNRQCQQAFTTRAALTWHVLNRHQDDDAFACELCNATFANAQEIRDHDCETTSRVQRSASADPTYGVRNDNSTLSAPASPAPNFVVKTGSTTPLQEPQSTSSIDFGRLFSKIRDEDEKRRSEGMPMFALPPMPPFSQAQNMTPFMLRPPFDPRGDMFVSRHDPEDDWEALMEISTSDEGEKIRALVGDKALPTTDPNQCILCRRVLSCKSALQMHYRTHTGERPFKCKICQRAFTTKGNLKTHMGVHRAKHSFRVMPMGMPPQMAMNRPPPHLQSPIQASQQCPICQKRVSNTAELQAHIGEHRNALTQRIPPPSSPALTPVGPFPGGFPFVPFFTPPASMAPTTSEVSSPFNLAQLLSKQMDAVAGIKKNEPPTVDLTENVRNEPKSVASLSPSNSSETSSSASVVVVARNECADASTVANGTDEPRRNGACSSSSASGSGDEAKCVESTNSDKGCDNPLLAMQKMWAETEPPPPRQMPVLSKHQCAVCFKHFSSSSALQIHMRTHTGDKPFKCEMCGRAFTTRGNLKVHMGTHVWQQSPSRRGRRIFEIGSSDGVKQPPTLNIPSLPLFPPTSLPNMEMMMMLWRTVCSVCQKVCSSPVELEQHLKEHLNATIPATPSPSQ